MIEYALCVPKCNNYGTSFPVLATGGFLRFRSSNFRGGFGTPAIANAGRFCERQPDLLAAIHDQAATTQPSTCRTPSATLLGAGRGIGRRCPGTTEPKRARARPYWRGGWDGVGAKFFGVEAKYGLPRWISSGSRARAPEFTTLVANRQRRKTVGFAVPPRAPGFVSPIGLLGVWSVHAGYGLRHRQGRPFFHQTSRCRKARATAWARLRAPSFRRACST